MTTTAANATPKPPANAVVWIELPVHDLDRACAFYSAVIGLKVEQSMQGPNLIGTLPYAQGEGVSGHLYVGTPASDGTGPTVHLGVSGKLEDALERVRDAGGTVVSEPIPMPFGGFFYAIDLDGNSIGLFEGT